MHRSRLPLTPALALLACTAAVSPRAGADPAGSSGSNALQTVVVTDTSTWRVT